MRGIVGGDQTTSFGWFGPHVKGDGLVVAKSILWLRNGSITQIRVVNFLHDP